MNNLQVNTKILTFILFFLLLLPSCNNEEIFIVEESAIIAEETEEITPNTEDEVIPIDAVDDTVFTTENSPVDIEAYLNDINLPESITLTNTNPSNGVLAINNNETPGNLLDDTAVYTPNAGFSGIDTFDYTICDATNTENCDTATVTITIEPIEEDIATELKAFPSAYGAASNITGGRGGTVIHVTDLSNSNSQGSLRWAISQKYPRTIVFDVSGEIDLGGSTQWFSGSDYGDLTIAGQTAPEGGITIVNGQFTIQSASNIIVRYIKFRGGYFQDQKDSFRVFQCSDVIIDHCDIWYGRDEGLDISDKNDETDGTVTVQNCLFAENKTAMILGIAENDKSNPSYQPVSVLNNLFVNNSHRFPKYDGEGRVDVINNGLHNWKWRTMRFDSRNFQLNEINNYYQAGTNSTSNTNTADGLNKVGTSASGYDIYTNGNYLTPSHAAAMGISGYDSDNTLGWSNYNNSNPVNQSIFVGSAFTQNGVAFTPLTSTNVKQHLIDNVGARHYLNADGSVGLYLDNLQTTYIGYFENNSNVDSMDYNSEYGTQATGVPSNTRPESYDTDGDGMPDTWERNIFNDLTQDSNGDHDGDGYTNIEEFTNLVDKQ